MECIRKFFKRRFKYESALYPRFNAIKLSDNQEGRGFRLDVVVAASGFTKKDQKVLEEVGFRFIIRFALHRLITFGVYGNCDGGRIQRE